MELIVGIFRPVWHVCLLRLLCGIYRLARAGARTVRFVV